MTVVSVRLPSTFYAGIPLLAFLLTASAVSGQAPTNDLFANRIPLTGLTNIFEASNVGASTEPGEPHHASSESTRSVWWTWTSPVTGTFTFSTAGSAFDTLVA